VVTGASSGIGAACARALALCGAQIFATGRNASHLEKLANEFSAITVIPLDLQLPGTPEDLVSSVQAKFGAVDILVNSAGYGDIGRSSRISVSDIDNVVAVNLRAPLMLMSRFGSGMAKRGRGSIINISSVVSSVGTPFQAAYSATKGALEAMTRSLAKEFGTAGVRVNCIAPGLIATEMWGERLQDETLVKSSAKYTALNSWGTAQMVADAVVFLASDASSYITAQTIYVDGGFTHTGDLVSPEMFGQPAKRS
jgi:NAD(P)-dependent dehydrogenase (short-subunit alcohol dehydrogenase family)